MPFRINALVLIEGAGRKRGPVIGSQCVVGGRSDVGISMQQGMQPKSSGTLSYQHSNNNPNQVISILCNDYKKSKNFNLISNVVDVSIRSSRYSSGVTISYTDNMYLCKYHNRTWINLNSKVILSDIFRRDTFTSAIFVKVLRCLQSIYRVRGNILW